MATEQLLGAEKRSTKSWTRLLPILACVLAVTGQVHHAEADIPEHAAGTSKAESTVRTSDQTAEALLSALKGQQYEAAYALFDSTMKAAVSEEKLKAIWSAQLATLGDLGSWSLNQGGQAQGLDIRTAVLQFEHGQLLATIAVNPRSQAVGGFFIKPYAPPPAPAPAAAYIDPSKFRALEVSVGTAPFVLGATLTFPLGPGPFPGVVLIHGSGPNDRDETIGGSKPFKDLAEGLASRGVAVLRYDKRTFTYGAKLGSDLSVDDEVIVDAIAAVKMLGATHGVDPARVFVVGHSMGAQLAPEIAFRSGARGGVALLAPPGRAPWDILLAQFRYLEVPKAQLEDTERKVALLKAGTLGDEKLLSAPQSYWKDLAAHDGIAMAKKLGVPILILRGDRDYQITDEDVAAWRTGLAGTPHVAIDILPGLNHLFIAGTGRPGPAEYSVPGHVDPQVIDKLSAFVIPAKSAAR